MPSTIAKKFQQLEIAKKKNKILSRTMMRNIQEIEGKRMYNTLNPEIINLGPHPTVRTQLKSF